MAWPHAILLIDEIDKADPDMPNNLLVALGSLQFEVAQTRFRVKVRVGAAYHDHVEW